MGEEGGGQGHLEWELEEAKGGSQGGVRATRAAQVVCPYFTP